MTAVRLTISLLRIPRLFAMLLAFPLLTSLMVLVGQLFCSAIFLHVKTSGGGGATEVSEERVADPEVNTASGNWFRTTLIGTDSYARELKICRWTKGADGKLVQPSDDCWLQRYDIVVEPSLLAKFPIEHYYELFLGKFRAIHVCDGCLTDIVIWRENGQVKTEFRSFLALALFRGLNRPAEFSNYYGSAMSIMGQVRKSLGDQYLVLAGFNSETSLKNLTTSFVLVANITLTIVIALWLALKAHRRVLDYFSHSGSLLPLVAATGSSSFYGAVWLLTGLRVVGFLLAGIPAGIIILWGAVESDPRALPFYGHPWMFLLWIVAVLVSLGLATLIASLAELRHHHSVVNVHFKLIPLGICVLGGLIWLASFVLEYKSVDTVRSLLAATPLIGVTPILLAPIFSPKTWAIVVNTLLTLAIIVSLAKRNTKWFVAHLDEI
jgi:hypothetical protein